MSASNVNVVVITGNLTRNPEKRSTGGGTSVCEMRVAVNSRRRDGSGEWVDKPNFFDVVAFGTQADNCATYLGRGRSVAVEGRLDWREWEAKDDGGRRQAVQIIANSVQFLGRKDDGKAEEGSDTQDLDGYAQNEQIATAEGPMTPGELEEDIPF